MKKYFEEINLVPKKDGSLIVYPKKNIIEFDGVRNEEIFDEKAIKIEKGKLNKIVEVLNGISRKISIFNEIQNETRIKLGISGKDAIFYYIIVGGSIVQTHISNKDAYYAKDYWGLTLGTITKKEALKFFKFV